jgi:signal transduction histidine kinase
MSEIIRDHDLNFFSHEIANVLMTVRGYAELLVQREGLDPDVRRYPKQIISAIDQATHKLKQFTSMRKKDPMSSACLRTVPTSKTELKIS